MACILLTGIATLDIINHVEHYPAEDEELRATEQALRRGGNAANSSEVLVQLGHHSSLAATLADDAAGDFIRADLQRKSIGSEALVTVAGATPTSYISLSRATGSRTIVHYRHLAELQFVQFDALALDRYDWFHFEARNCVEQQRMMQKARHTGRPVSLELEKPRDRLDLLVELADVVMVSRHYANAMGYTDPQAFLVDFAPRTRASFISLTWGEQGAWGWQNGDIIQVSAFPVEQLVDTLGAGDTFNAALIDALVNNMAFNEALSCGCKLAAKKCSQYGFEQLIETDKQ